MAWNARKIQRLFFCLESGNIQVAEDVIFLVSYIKPVLTMCNKPVFIFSQDLSEHDIAQFLHPLCELQATATRIVQKRSSNWRSRLQSWGKTNVTFTMKRYVCTVSRTLLLKIYLVIQDLMVNLVNSNLPIPLAAWLTMIDDNIRHQRRRSKLMTSWGVINTSSNLKNFTDLEKMEIPEDKLESFSTYLIVNLPQGQGLILIPLY